MFKKIFAIALVGALSCLWAGGAFAAAYKVTAGGQTETVCSASAAAWKLYNVAKERPLTDGRIERLADDGPESMACQAERQARLDAQPAGERSDG